MPVAHMASIVPISQSVGANRIIPTVAIPYPLGNPALSAGEEKAVRRKLVEKALAALQTEVAGQTVF
jgi:glycine reductase